jgi:hypothetical protein
MAASKIIDKVRKLLELADETRGGTEAERNLAAERAAELMAKHNLAQGDLTGQSAPGEVGDDVQHISGSMDFWKVTLACAIGRVSMVDSFYVKRARFAWDLHMIGRQDNVTYVQTLCQHLIPWLEQEQKDAYKAAREIDPTVKPRSFGMAFYEAACYEIQGRCRKLRDSTFEGSGMELIKNEEAANKQFMLEKGHNVRPSGKRGHGSARGHAAGRKAGSEADLLPGKKLNS